MKKEVISYCGFSMMPPETVELLDNNKGRVIIDEIAQIVDISACLTRIEDIQATADFIE